MQKTIFLVLFFMLNALNATNLLKYDVFDGEQNIDLKLSFDTPYRGEITQTNEKNMVIVTLKDLNLAEKFNHQINSQIGSEFVISPMDNAVKIELNTNKNIVVKPSLNDDKSELMLKFSQSTQSAILPQSKAQDESEMQPSNLVRNGVILITGLLIFIVFLIIAKRMFGTKNGKNDDEIWTAFENASMDNTAQKMDKEADLNTNLDDINIANLQPNFVLKNDDENIRFSNNIAQSIKNSEKISEQNSKNKAQNLANISQVQNTQICSYKQQNLNSQISEILNQYENLAIGFWLDRGGAAPKFAKFLREICDKKIALFMSCGADPQSEHSQKIIDKVASNLIAQGNEIAGKFVCQGKISDEIIAQICAIYAQKNIEIPASRIENWEKSRSHPDENDLKNAREFFAKVFH